MANSLGQLVVRLGLDANEFTSGLTKSEHQAKRFADNLSNKVAVGVVKAEVAMRAFDKAVQLAFRAIPQLIDQAAGFQDLAEKTGASAEALASLSVAAQVGGSDMNTVAAAAVKLTAGLVGVDDESKKAGAALAAIGLEVKAFKQLDPVSQMEAVAKALSNFEDGAEKTAVAVALFGKAGADMLPFLKELGEGVGRQNILTAEQIRLADEYADKQARAKAELNAYAQALATQAVPALLAVQNAVVDVIKELLGLARTSDELANSRAILDFAENAALAIATVGEAAIGTAKLVRAIAGSFQAVAADLQLIDPVLRAKNILTGDYFKKLEERNKTVKEANDRYVDLWNYDGTRMSQAIRDNFAAQRNALDPEVRKESARLERARMNALGGAGGRPRIKFDGADGKAGKDAAAKMSEADRYLENLNRQLQGVQELTLYEKTLQDIQAGRLGKITAAQEAAILATAKEIDATRDAVKVSNERADARRRENEQIEEFLRLTEQQDRQRLNSMLSQGPNAQLEKQRKDMQFLADSLTSGKITADQFNDAATGMLGLNKEAEKGKTLFDELGATFSSAFEDAIVGGRGLSDVLKGLEQDIVRIVTRKLVTEPLANWIGDTLKGLSTSGGGSGGGGGSGFLDSLVSWGATLFGGGRAIGGPVEPGRMYRVNERGPEVLDVNGRQYLMNGSQRGTVRPMSGAMRGGDTYHVNVQMPAGGSRQTAMQFGATAARELARASSRNR
jgi:uncharacterized spore protein YtfJ